MALFGLLVLFAIPARAEDHPAKHSSMAELKVACVQLASQADPDFNARAIVDALQAEAKQGTRLVTFPECALTAYDPDIIKKLKPEQIDRALATVKDGCRKAGVYAVVGSPYFENNQRYNGAFVIDPTGRVIKRFAKVHNVEADLFIDGQELAIFRIDDVPTTIIICHDERYPELFRIPVLAGAKLGIYISCESKEPLQKQDNYRSQIMARAVENQITVVHCNTGDGGVGGGSHGHSRIIDKDGKILAEAGRGDNEVIRAVVHPDRSSNAYARAGAETATLRKFWEEGLRLLREQNPEYFAPTSNPVP
jgi:predicted amidohydrolase